MTTDPTPPASTERKGRGPWPWIVCGVLVLVAAGLLIWALNQKSDLDKANQKIASMQQQAAQGGGGGGAAAASVTAALKSAYDQLSQQLGQNSTNLTAAKQDLNAAQQSAAQAQKNADAARKTADQATTQADKLNATADQAKAEVGVAQAKAQVAASCARASWAALGELFAGGSVRGQVQPVKQQLQGIAGQCKSTLGS